MAADIDFDAQDLVRRECQRLFRALSSEAATRMLLAQACEDTAERILEISQRTTVADAEAVIAEIKTRMAEHAERFELLRRSTEPQTTKGN